MQAVVLCGGEGVRLRPLTFYFQKTMVPIGEKEKPLLEYVVRLLTHYGFDEIIMLTNYRANQITNYFNEGPRFNAKFSFIQDSGTISGTGGSLLNARDDLKDNFVIYYGDILSSINLAEMWRKHIETESACTVALARDFPVRVGVAELGDADDVRGFEEKPMLHRPVSIGIFALNKRALDVIDEIVSTKQSKGQKPSADLPGEIIPELIRRGDKVKAYMTDAFWYDVGSLERYEKLENHVVEKELSFLFS